MKKIVILCILFALMLPLTAGCGQKQSDKALLKTLSEMKTLGESLETLTAEVVQSATQDGQETRAEYRLWYSKGRYRMEWDENGSLQVEIFDGTDAWTYVEGQGTVLVKRNVTKDDMFAFLQSFQEIFNVTYKETAEVDGRAYHVLQGTMKSNPEVANLTWWVDKESGFPVIAQNETELWTATARYHNIEINPEIEESLFSFSPPKGSEIIDLTNSENN